MLRMLQLGSAYGNGKGLVREGFARSFSPRTLERGFLQAREESDEISE